MSDLPNPKQYVTEERLNEYHNIILPFLGGMPDILANKFARGDMYSTDEKMIGQWIDGKPLYQKTITGKCPNSTTPKSYAHNIANVDMIKISDAFMYWGQGAYSPIPVYSASTSVPISTACITITSVDGTEFKLRADENRSAYDFYITFQYTKTTDSPVEIGLDTDYSTTEKIVGTWVDGKPLYQKTYTLTSEIALTPNTWVTLVTEASLSNIDVFVDFRCCRLHTVPRVDNIPCVRINQGKVEAYTTLEFDQIKFFTIQYTKTTD